MVIKGKADVPAFHRSRFIFACSLGIERHSYAIKCTHTIKPEPRNSQNAEKIRKYLSCRNGTFTV